MDAVVVASGSGVSTPVHRATGPGGIACERDDRGAWPSIQGVW